MTASATALEMRSISKAFGPVQALLDVSFTARAGAVHALCGENGAGKSTLMKILAGSYQPDAGTISLGGETRVFGGPQDALESGISMLYQELDLATDLKVYENVYLGEELRHPRVPFLTDENAMIEKVATLIGTFGFEIEATDLVRDLPQGKRQLVELLKAVHRESKIIVMDEPTSSLSETEARRLFEIVGDLREQGLAVVYISHRMDEVMELADDISVLRDGEVVASGPAAEFTIDSIVTCMVGRELTDFYPEKSAEIGEVYFEATRLASKEGIHDITFSVRKGEIVGMAGLIGAGRTETARAIFGACPRSAGEVSIDGKALSIKSPSHAIKQGIAFLTEDRKSTGLCVNLPCHWNVALPNYDRIGMGHVLDPKREYNEAARLGKDVRVKWLAPDAPVSSLSGGNQQKVLLARWLLADARFLIFDEPTRGIDVGAKREIYLLLNDLAAQGKAILVISSELSELFGICDRILVMREGRLVGDKQVAETTPEEVMHLAAVEGEG